MKQRSLVVLLSTTALLALPATAYAGDYQVHRHHASAQQQDQGDDSGDNSGDDDSGDDSSSDPSPDQVQPDNGTDDDMPQMDQGDPSTRAVAAHGPAQTITAEITGYSFQDNTPEGSATISMPVLHRVAGGVGTFTNPITTAVPGSADSPETPRGTKLYVPKLRRYFIVEDSGASSEGTRHFDLYVDGQGFSKSDSDACMNSYTGSTRVILNPPAGEPVTVGPLTTRGGCKLGGALS